ncbi:proteasome adapter and scaffold protein ecm29 [Anaeramoeba flamelloides]|uniref:Proteasome adapter and scaffold protein ecm29 n=1 Tax=Anaeramoeba flamelloides TaxID=1746091 RepID=A0AAV8A4R6_9EUKA|nr:proteasome adapter and scaffold protein ecm29 [Anaeramoeba flamelloides]
MSSTEDRELRLLESVFFKFAGVSGDEEFEKFLSTYLPALLLKLKSPRAAIQKKLIEIFNEINKRVQLRSNVKLPLSMILTVFKQSQALRSMQQNIILMYLCTAIKRSTVEERVQNLNDLLMGISKLAKAQQFKILDNIVLTLGYLKVPKETEDLKKALPFLYNEDDLKIILNGIRRQFELTEMKSQNKGTNSIESKIKLIQFLNNISNTVVNDTITLPIFILAMSNPNDKIKESTTRKLKSDLITDFENKELVNQLFELFLGNKKTKRPMGTPLLRINSLTYLLRSKVSTKMFPFALQIIFECLFGGTTTPPLRRLGMEYTHWLFLHTTDLFLSKTSKVLLNAMKKIVNKNSEFDPLVKGFAYVAIGEIARRTPSLINNDIELIKFLFSELEDDANENLFPQIRQSILLFHYAYYQNLNKKVKVLLSDFLLTKIVSKEKYVRSTLSDFINITFPFNDPISRIINLFGTCDSQRSVRNSAQEGLLPYEITKDSGTRLINKDSAYPSVKKILKVLKNKLFPIFENELKSYKTIYLMNPQFISNIIKFINKCWINETKNLNKDKDSSKEKEKEKEKENNEIEIEKEEEKEKEKVEKKKKKITNKECILFHINKMKNKNNMNIENDDELIEELFQPLWKLCDLSFQIYQQTINLDIYETILIFSKLILNFPTIFNKKIINNEEIFSLLIKIIQTSSSADLRRETSKIIGLLVPDLKKNKILELLNLFSNSLIKPKNKSIMIEYHGSIYSLTYLISSCWYHCGNRSKEIQDEIKTTIKEIYQKIKPIISKLLKNENKLDNFWVSLSAIEFYKYIFLFARDLEENLEEIILIILEILKKPSNNEIRVQKLILTLGICSIGSSQNLRNKILKIFLALIKNNKESLQFAIGDAFSLLTFGINSKCLVNPFLPLDFQEKWKKLQSNNFLKQLDVDVELEQQNQIGSLNVILDLLLNKLLISGDFSIRTSATIWLISLINNCIYSIDHYDNLTITIFISRFNDIHDSLLNLLGDPNSLVEDLATEALLVIYEIGGESLKKQLVQSMIGALSKGHKRKIFKKEGDEIGLPLPSTQQQQGSSQGGNGNNNENRSRSDRIDPDQNKKKKDNLTYQELYSLSNKMGKPQLVYSLIGLAKSEHLFNSKRSSALGLAKIAEQSRREILPYLPDILPSLYLSTFDPNNRVSSAMETIFKILIKEKTKTINEYFHQIMEEIINSIGNNIWRKRQAATLALAEIIKGKSFEQLEKYLEKIIIFSYRTRDDIKQSVREASKSLNMSCRGVFVRLCDPNKTSKLQGSKAVSILLPYLLEKGVNSRDEDAQNWSIKLVSAIITISGINLRKHLSKLIPLVLIALGKVEPEKMNYLQFHIEKFNLSQEDYEQARLFLGKFSPIGDSLRICIEQINDDVIPEIMPELIKMIQKNLGLLTKVSLANLISTICNKFAAATKPYCLKLLKNIKRQLNGTSPTLRKAFAKCSASVLNICDNKKEIVNYLNYIIEMYIQEINEPPSRDLVATLFLEISKKAKNILTNNAKLILPLAFLAKNDSNKEIKKTFSEIWYENISSESIALENYFNQVLDLAFLTLQNNSWEIRKYGAFSLKKMADVIVSSSNNSFIRKKLIDNDYHYANLIFDNLMGALRGRTWDGKESILYALSSISKVIKPIFNNKEEKLIKFIKLIIRETKKRALKYRKHASSALGKIIDIFFESTDQLWNDGFELIKLCYDQIKEQEIERLNECKKKENEYQIVKEMNEVVGRCLNTLLLFFPSSKNAQEKYCNAVFPWLVNSLKNTDWFLRLLCFTGIKTSFERIDLSLLDNERFLNFVDEVGISLKDGKHSSLRKRTLEAFEILIEFNERHATQNLKILLLKWLNFLENEKDERINTTRLDLLNKLKK